MQAVQNAVKKLAQKENLDYQLARKAALEIMEGKASQVLISAFLVGLSAKGETSEEIAAISETMLEKAIKVELCQEGLLDTCGTGGDGSQTFNISTAAAFVCASLGVPVAKHGNRSQSSVSGSADVIEALGGRADLAPEEARRVFEETGITFIFAPIYHPAMKHAAPVRKELGIRTVFNFVGPIVNPALAQFRLLGVSSKEHVKKVADALLKVGVKRAFVYHSENGLDEIALDSDVYVVEIDGGSIREFTLNHKDFGIEKTDHRDVVVNTPEESARAILSVLKNEKSPFYNYVVANAAAGLYVAGASKSIIGAVEMAKKAISSGKAFETLKRFVEATGGKLAVS